MGDLDFAERDMTISWVLSPNSAKKIRLNVINEAFQSNAGSPHSGLSSTQGYEPDSLSRTSPPREESIQMIRRLLLIALLGALLTGCAKATPWPGHGPEGQSTTAPPVNAPNATNPSTGTNTGTTQPGAAQPGTVQPGANQPGSSTHPDGSVPGDSKALEAALSAPSTLSYQIEVVTEPVDDLNKYLDDRLAQNGPGPNELLFLLFATKNYDIRFGMGAMNPPLSVDQVYAQVKAHYLANKSDPAAGMAALITALNQLH